MQPLIKYYFWTENHRKEWYPLGCLYGYNSEKECIKDNLFAINNAKENGYNWTILEAIPTSHEQRRKK